jgi:hypothetical protein
MEYDYTHLNHNLLMSQKNGHQRPDFKGGYCRWLSFSLCVKFQQNCKT